jgi:hypothetical protein
MPVMNSWCKCRPQSAQQRLETFAATRKGWTVKASDPGTVQIEGGMNPRTFRKQIDASIAPAARDQSFVRLSCASPQLFDWDDGRRALDALRRALAE